MSHLAEIFLIIGLILAFLLIVLLIVIVCRQRAFLLKKLAKFASKEESTDDHLYGDFIPLISLDSIIGKSTRISCG